MLQSHGEECRPLKHRCEDSDDHARRTTMYIMYVHKSTEHGAFRATARKSQVTIYARPPARRIAAPGSERRSMHCRSGG